MIFTSRCTHPFQKNSKRVHKTSSDDEDYDDIPTPDYDEGSDDVSIVVVSVPNTKISLTINQSMMHKILETVKTQVARQ